MKGTLTMKKTETRMETRTTGTKRAYLAPSIECFFMEAEGGILAGSITDKSVNFTGTFGTGKATSDDDNLDPPSFAAQAGTVMKSSVNENFD
jgi:hypothetical protein